MKIRWKQLISTAAVISLASMSGGCVQTRMNVTEFQFSDNGASRKAIQDAVSNFYNIFQFTVRNNSNANTILASGYLQKSTFSVYSVIVSEEKANPGLLSTNEIINVKELRRLLFASPTGSVYELIGQKVQFQTNTTTILDSREFWRTNINNNLIFTKSRLSSDPQVRGVALSQETREFMMTAGSAEVPRLNRLILQDIFPSTINRMQNDKLVVSLSHRSTTGSRNATFQEMDEKLLEMMTALPCELMSVDRYQRKIPIK